MPEARAAHSRELWGGVQYDAVAKVGAPRQKLPPSPTSTTSHCDPKANALTKPHVNEVACAEVFNTEPVTNATATVGSQWSSACLGLLGPPRGKHPGMGRPGSENPRKGRWQALGS